MGVVIYEYKIDGFASSWLVQLDDGRLMCARAEQLRSVKDAV